MMFMYSIFNMNINHIHSDMVFTSNMFVIVWVFHSKGGYDDIGDSVSQICGSGTGSGCCVV